MAKDYYKILEIDKNASKEEIKKAYKKLARKYHPDVSKEENSEQKFKDINEAAGVLLDDQKKKQYDTYGSAEGGPSGFGGFEGFGSGGFDPSDFGINIEDIFESFGFGGFGSSSSRARHHRRKDTRVFSEIEVDLEDIYFGSKKNIKINREIKCENCNGKGAVDEKDIEICQNCNGSGVVIEMQRSILGNIKTQRPCNVCNGKGKTIKDPCSVCNGKGKKNNKETIEINIPKGIENGVTLKVNNKGDYDPETDTYGDLYLKIYIKQNKDYEIDGSDLYKTLNVNFIQAILGDEIEFEHFDKTLSVKIPNGTQSGTILRLKSKGLPYFNYDMHGDLYLKVNVEIPKKTTKEQKKILHEYAKTLKDKNLVNRLKNLFK